MTVTSKRSDPHHVPCVLVYDARGNGGGTVCPTITGEQMISMDPPQKKVRHNSAAPPLPPIIAVDFDGTLCVNRWPDIGRARQPVIDWLVMQKQKGCKLILWTMREGEKLAEAVSWCAEHGLTFDAVNDNLPETQKMYGNNPRKVFANYYLDDHNI